MQTFNYDNLLEKHDITVIQDDDGFLLSGHRLKWRIPSYLNETITSYEEKFNITFNELSPLYADFHVTVERESSYTEDP